MKGLGVLLLLAGLAGSLVAGLTAPGQETLAAAAARIETLQAEAAALGARIEVLEQANVAEDPGTTNLHRATTASEATLGLQQGLVDLARQNGLELSTFASHPAPEGLTLPAVAVVLEGEGEIADLARFLAAIEATRPPVAVSQLTLRDQSQRRAEGGMAPVAFRIAAWSLWTEGDG